MALAAAAAVPDLLSGVIAIDGFLPIVPGWDPPLAPLDGLPILQIDNASDDDSTAGVLAGPSLAATLRDWGGEVTRRRAPSGEIPGEVMSTWMRAQAPRHRAVRPAG